jgi:hypothetical protein
MEEGIKATTGFQSKGYDHVDLVNWFKACLGSDNKLFEFTQSRLRGANDIVQKGGHVTQTLRDQIFRLVYDNRRQISEPQDFEGCDMSKQLFDSTPLATTLECQRLRFLSKLPFSLPFSRGSSKSKNKKYRSYLEVAVRNFLKGYLSKEPCFGLKGTEFKRSKDIISFIYGNVSAKDVRISDQSISNLKHRKIIFKLVPKTVETLYFARYVKEKLPNFDIELFFK